MDETARSYDRGAQDFLARRRDRSFLDALIPRFTRHLEGDLVLDVGCGPGFDAAAFRASGLRAIGVDYSLGMMRAGRTDYPGAFVRADMRRLPFPAIASGLWVNASMLHIEREDIPALMLEFRRVLQPGGILFVSVKAGSGTHWETGPNGFPPRRFTYWQPDQLDAALTEFTILDSWGGEKKGNWLNRIGRRE